MAAEKKSEKEKPAKDRLIKQLNTILPEIDEKGLLFLIRQANTLLYNIEVERLNAENKNKPDEKPKKKGTTARVKAEDTDVTVEIDQSDDGKTYYIIINNQKHFIDIPEMQTIVKLCYKPETKSAALKFLFQFFDVERKEVLIDHGIQNQKHPFFEALFYETRNKFTLND